MALTKTTDQAAQAPGRMNYYQAIIAKATGVEPGQDMDDIVIAMDVRFGDLTERQIASKAKRAWAEVQEVRALGVARLEELTGGRA